MPRRLIDRRPARGAAPAAAVRRATASTSPWHTGHAAGSPMTRPSHTRDITSSSVGPARGEPATLGVRSSPAIVRRRPAGASAVSSASSTSGAISVSHASSRRASPRLERSRRRRSSSALRPRRSPSTRGLGGARSAAPGTRRPAPRRGAALLRLRPRRRRREHVEQRRLAHVIRVVAALGHQRTHYATLRITPTTRPRTLHLARADRLQRLVLRLQPHVVGLLEEALHRRLLAHERDDDLAVLRRVLLAHDDDVVRQDARVHHRVAAHAQEVLALLAAGDLGDLDVLLDVLLGQQRLTRGHMARRAAARSAAPPTSPRRRADVAVDAARSSSSIARGLDGSRRSSPTFSRLARCACTVDDDARPDRLADVTHRRRIAVAGRVALDEVEDLLLALRQILPDVHAVRASP